MVKAHRNSETAAAAQHRVCTGLGLLSIYYASGLLVLWDLECVNERVSMCLFFGFFTSVLSNSNASVFVLFFFFKIFYYYPLEACLFSKGREEVKSGKL